MSSLFLVQDAVVSPIPIDPLYSEGAHIVGCYPNKSTFCLVRATCAAFLARLRLARPLLLFFLPYFFVFVLSLCGPSGCICQPDACLGSWVGSTILFRLTLLLPRVYVAYPSSVRPFHSYLGCSHCALCCCITPVSMPGHWGSTPCCCQSWTDGRYPDLVIAVTPIDQTQAPRQYEARARASIFVEWSLRVTRPLADLGPPRQEQARGG